MDKKEILERIRYAQEASELSNASQEAFKQIDLCRLALKGLAAEGLEKACEFYADAENYTNGSGSSPPFTCEFGNVIEHPYPAIPGDDTGDLARQALEAYRKETV